MNLLKNIILILTLPVLSIFGYVAVKAYAEPYVDSRIEIAIDPIEKQIQRLILKLDTIAFTTNQTLLTVELLHNDSLVNKVKRKTERFRN